DVRENPSVCGHRPLQRELDAARQALADDLVRRDLISPDGGWQNSPGLEETWEGELAELEMRFDHIVAAKARIASGIRLTPCSWSPALSEICGCEIYPKLEYLQRTGSFKERGARNALLLLDEEQRKRGVIAASAGNHALAMAYHGRDLGTPVTVVMPRF